MNPPGWRRARPCQPGAQLHTDRRVEPFLQRSAAAEAACPDTPNEAGGPANHTQKAGDMNTDSPTITPQVAAHVLSHFGRDGGYPAGSFTERLISVIDFADDSNLAKLQLSFPEYVAAILAIQRDPDGVAHLQSIAGGSQ